jgi:hypothetical protein
MQLRTLARHVRGFPSLRHTRWCWVLTVYIVGGATSKDVHAGLGKPVGPQSSAQLNSSGDNVVPGKKDGQGLVGLDNVTDAKNPNGPKNA